MAQFIQSNSALAVTLVGTLTVNAADSGRLHMLSAAPGGGTVISLPLLPGAGTHYRFMLTAAAANEITIGVAGGIVGVRGSLINCNGAAAVTLPVINTSVTVGFGAGAQPGDWIDCYNVGGNIWSVSGLSGVNNGLAVV
jgi:hypothetical protein